MQQPTSFNQDQLNVITQSYSEEINRLLQIKANLGLRVLALTKENDVLKKENDFLKAIETKKEETPS